MKSKTLFMETTEVPAERTASEISAVLIQAGATQINIAYEGGEIVGLRWTMRVSGGRELLFRMPARVDPIFKIFQKRRTSQWDRTNKAADDLVKAKRVAWRQLLRWTQAQLAMIECGMTEAAEVFFPYIQAPTGRTLFEHFKDTEFKALPAPDVQ